MKVSIIINSYNYASYINAAIDSALAQTYRRKGEIEVIVVDDGSTDESWSLIQAYGNRIISLRKDNGGQGSAYNLGWEVATGEFVHFLDSDDLLDPEAIEVCMSLMAPDVSSVQYRLRLIGPRGERLGGCVPILMHSGDVRPVVCRFAHYAGPPASGNFYRRSAIAAVFPLEASRWRRAADTVPFVTAAFFGRIVSVPRELGSYRLHRANRRPQGLFGNTNTSFRDALLMDDNRRNAVPQILKTRAGIELPGPFTPLPWTIRTRALSWRLDRENHPYSDDTARSILQLQREALRYWPGYTVGEKLLLYTWVALVLTMPRPLVQRLAASNASGSAKALAKRLLGGAR